MREPNKNVKGTKLLAIVLGAMVVLFVALTLIFMSGCNYLDDYPDDNIAEELAEETIDHYTGIDIDFTPWSPEESIF